MPASGAGRQVGLDGHRLRIRQRGEWSSAKVSVRNESTNLAAATVTTEGNGNYSVPGLPVGSYSVTVQAAGFETLVTDMFRPRWTRSRR